MLVQYVDNVLSEGSGVKLDIVKAMTKPFSVHFSIKDECMRESRLERFFSCIKAIDSSAQLLPSIETGGLKAVKLLLPPDFPFTKIRSRSACSRTGVVGHNSNEDHITKDFVTFILSNNWCSNNYGTTTARMRRRGTKCRDGYGCAKEVRIVLTGL